jgi:predicted house-cleaning noncanonical NTP pyrophosphatase (MazG superfamily)
VLEEAADVLEIVRSLAAMHGYTLDDIVRIACEKRSKRGGFDKWLWLEDIKM